MPLTAKGEKIMRSMKEQYGGERGEEVFYASKNAGRISGVDRTDDAVSRGDAASINLDKIAEGVHALLKRTDMAKPRVGAKVVVGSWFDASGEILKIEGNRALVRSEDGKKEDWIPVLNLREKRADAAEAYVNIVRFGDGFRVETSDRKQEYFDTVVEARRHADKEARRLGTRTIDVRWDTERADVDRISDPAGRARRLVRMGASFDKLKNEFKGQPRDVWEIAERAFREAGGQKERADAGLVDHKSLAYQHREKAAQHKRMTPDMRPSSMHESARSQHEMAARFHDRAASAMGTKEYGSWAKEAAEAASAAEKASQKAWDLEPDGPPKKIPQVPTRADAANEYVPLLRPPGRSTLPNDISWEYVELPRDFSGNRPDLKRGTTRYGVIRTSRALTKEEQEHFDLRPA